VRWVDVKLFEMGQVVREHLHQCEAYRNIPVSCYPEPSIAGGLPEPAHVGSLGED
jgi:hypothetical protein